MFTGLEDNRIFVLAATVVLLAVSYALAPFLDKYSRRQHVIVLEEALSDKRATAILVVKQLAFAAFIFGASWLIGGPYFQVFAGGYLLSLLVGIMLSLQNVFYLHGLSLPGAASGSVKFSPSFAYRNLAMRLLAAAVLMLGLFLIFGKLHFLGACFYSAATCMGYMRRSGQAQSASESPDA